MQDSAEPKGSPAPDPVGEPPPTITYWDPPPREDGDDTRAPLLTSDVVRRFSREITALSFLIGGIIFVTLGWYGAAHTNIITEQIPYLISGGLLGLGMIIVAGIQASAIASDRERRHLADVIERTMAARPMQADGAVAPTNGSVPTVVLALKAGRAYHVPGCPIVEGKESVTQRTLVDAREAGLGACKLCGPDE